MNRYQTAKIANSDIVNGEKLYIQRARKALPILVSFAKMNKTIVYSDLAELLDMKNPRNLNFVLGAIGNAIDVVKGEWNKEIPPIQCLVLNKNTNLPGDGISLFLSKDDFKNLPQRKKRSIVDAALANIYTYDSWDNVLKAIGLTPINQDFTSKLDESLKFDGNSPGGEGELHKKLKEYIYNNPKAVHVNKKIEHKYKEYTFPTGDAVDVKIIDKESVYLIEVKSRISDRKDILRGLFQCVKYNSLMEAEYLLSNKNKDIVPILAMENKFPKEYQFIKVVLGITIIDEIKIK